VAVRDNEPVAIFSLEMSKESLLMRLLAFARAHRRATVSHRAPSLATMGGG